MDTRWGLAYALLQLYKALRRPLQGRRLCKAVQGCMRAYSDTPHHLGTPAAGGGRWGQHTQPTAAGRVTRATIDHQAAPRPLRGLPSTNLPAHCPACRVTPTRPKTAAPASMPCWCLDPCSPAHNLLLLPACLPWSQLLPPPTAAGLLLQIPHINQMLAPQLLATVTGQTRHAADHCLTSAGQTPFGTHIVRRLLTQRVHQGRL